MFIYFTCLSLKKMSSSSKKTRQIRLSNKPPIEIDESTISNDDLKNDVEYLKQTTQLENQAINRFSANLKFAVYTQLKSGNVNPISGLYSLDLKPIQFNKYLGEGNDDFEKILKIKK